MADREKLKRRLKMYWQVEAFNGVAIIPLSIFLAFWHGSRVGWLGITCMIPTVALLIVGAIYWRGKLRRLTGFTREQSLDGPLGLADRLEMPLRLLCVVSIVLCLCGWLIPGFAISSGDRWVATLGAVGALLEQINYYHRQLQHFDHWEDFKRLLTGGGFRRAQMAVDLQAWRKRKRG